MKSSDDEEDLLRKVAEVRRTRQEDERWRAARREAKRLEGNPPPPPPPNAPALNPPKPTSSRGFGRMNEAKAMLIVQDRHVRAVKNIMVPLDKLDKFTNRPRPRVKGWIVSVERDFHPNSGQWTSETNRSVQGTYLCMNSACCWALRLINQMKAIPGERIRPEYPYWGNFVRQ